MRYDLDSQRPPVPLKLDPPPVPLKKGEAIKAIGSFAVSLSGKPEDACAVDLSGTVSSSALFKGFLVPPLFKGG